MFFEGLILTKKERIFMLRIVMGYGAKGSKDLKALYVGEDGEEAEKVLYAESEKYPRREYLVRPQPVKVRVDPTKEEIERGKQQLEDEAKAAEAEAEAKRLAAIDPVAVLQAENDALAAELAELKAGKADAPPAGDVEKSAPEKEKKK